MHDGYYLEKEALLETIIDTIKRHFWEKQILVVCNNTVINAEPFYDKIDGAVHYKGDIIDTQYEEPRFADFICDAIMKTLNKK